MDTKASVVPYSQLRRQPRQDLKTLIPLSMPFSLFVEPTNVCNFKCGMCPQSLDDYKEQSGYFGHMSMETWAKLYTDINAMGATGRGRLKVIRFFGTGEPLLNPHLCEMIAASRDVADRLELTTNGSLLEKRAGDVARCGLTYVRVSVYGTSNEEYRRVTGRGVFTLGDVIEGVKTLQKAKKYWGSSFPKVCVQLTVPEPNEKLFREQWQGIADECVVEPFHNWGGSDQRLVHLGSGLPKGKIVCPKPFKELIIKSDGSVALCCADWNNAHELGNLHKQSLKEIWEGEALAEIRRLHLSGRRCELEACKDCTLIYKEVDDLDPLVR